MKLIYWIIAIIVSFMVSMLTQIYFLIRGSENKKEKIKEIKSIVDAKHIGIIILEVIVSMVMFYYSSVHNRSTIHCFKNMCTFLLLFPMALIDYKEKIIPNKIILATLSFWFILNILNIVIYDAQIKQSIMFSLGGLLFGGGVFLVCSFIIKGSVGMGDVKLFSVLGMLYGFNGLFTLLFITLLILFVLCIAMLIGKKVDKKSTFPINVI